MELLNDLKNIIDETQSIIDSLSLLPSPVSEQNEFEVINNLVTERTTHIELFLKKYDIETLEKFTPQLSLLIKKDKQMIKLADDIKKDMTQKIIKQKITTKANNAYSNMT